MHNEHMLQLLPTSKNRVVYYRNCWNQDNWLCWGQEQLQLHIHRLLCQGGLPCIPKPYTHACPASPAGQPRRAAAALWGWAEARGQLWWQQQPRLLWDIPRPAAGTSQFLASSTHACLTTRCGTDLQKGLRERDGTKSYQDCFAGAGILSIALPAAWPAHVLQ